MPILWDSVLAGAAAAALRTHIKGGRTRAIHLDHEAREVLLWGRDWVLLVRLHPERGDLLLLPPTDPFPGARPLAARVSDVRSVPDERILLLELRRPRGPGIRTLVLEWIPTRFNALVVEGQVVGAGPPAGAPVTIRHVLHTREGARPVAPGLPYRLPASQGRFGVAEPPPSFTWPAFSGEEEPGKPGGRPGGEHGGGPGGGTRPGADGGADGGATGGGPGAGPGGGAGGRGSGGADQGKELLRTLAWTSPLNLSALVDRSPTDALRQWHQMRRVALGELPGEGFLVQARGGWTPYPVLLPDAEPIPGGLLEAFRVAAERNQPGASATGLASLVDPQLLEALARELGGVRRRVAGLRRELERTPDPEGVRARGDLLLARFGEIHRGAAKVVLEDFEGNPVEIPLDPTLPPHQNAARFYAEAARIERAREQLPARIEKAEARLALLTSLKEGVLDGTVDPGQLKQHLPLHPSRNPGGKPGSPGDAGPSLPYRRYRSSGGLEIRVGRGAGKNDDLTFRHSAPDDVWLHARESAGAHVILRWPGPGNPPARDLEEAAILAALHSRARSSGSAPVDWTFRKYVRKPRKAPPGRVRVDRARTLFVEPDPTLPTRLALDGGDLPTEKFR